MTFSTTSTAPAAPAIPIAARSTGKLPPWAMLGILFGVVGALSIIAWGPIGVSGTYPRVIGELFRATIPEYAASNPYLVRMGSILKPETFLVIGLLIGGVIGARFDRVKAPKLEMTYPADPADTSTAKRYRDAFLGGVLIVFGARVAGGCTSGHIISGMTQLSISGFVFAAGVFATGIGTAKLLNARHVGGK